MEKTQEIQAPDLLAYWKRWQHVAPGMLKEIRGGNLNGKSDINPMWRFQVLTETFGPAGFGWNVREAERWTNECAGEVGAFVKVELRINIGGTWSEPIEGVGGSKLCGKGRGDGLNDEAWKMATTDAISVACKSLGIGADVYFGRQSHRDSDQKAAGPDYGTKYESRNYAQNPMRSGGAVTSTARTRNGQNPAPQAANPAGYGPAPVVASTGQPVQMPGTPAQLPVQGAQQQRVHVVLSTVTTGRCKNLIAALARHDYDDAADWQAGIEELRARYFIDDDALQEIAARAVEQRNAAYQQSVDGAFQM